MKVGILGGTFDPIHKAHVMIAKEAMRQFELDKVLVMPTPYPPHKDKSKLTGNFHRANMIRLALKDIENIEFSDFELNNTTTTYTADTLSMLKELYPENDYYFILGSDSIASFMSWYRPDAILKYATILVVKRDDESAALMESKINEIEKEFNVNIGIINMDSLDISSSFIRVHDYSEIEKSVPKSVFRYIKDNELYQNNNVNTAWSVNKITEDLRVSLPESRFNHTIGVAKTAKEMAECFSVNPNQAYLAGILHDCAKKLTNEELLQICETNDIAVTDSEKASPYLLHAKVGAYVAATKYGITDKEVLSAIVWHTTGKGDMTTLEKIIFSADYIEPGRNKQPNLEYLRKIAKTDLDMLVYSILNDTLEYLKNSGNKSIDENTINAYEFYKKLINER